jgi:cholesterol oxidase
VDGREEGGEGARGQREDEGFLPQVGPPVSDGRHYDAIVVGSGFGGSVSAYRLQEGGKQVCLLERGRAYAPGDFPRSPREIARNFWDPDEGLYGFFEIWTFKRIEALVSSCLGGGSIIYANVLLPKDPQWFVHEDGEDWPVTRQELDPHYDRVEQMIRPQTYPFAETPYSQTPKTQAMRDAAKEGALDWRLPPLAVTFGNPGEKPVPGVPIKDGANLYGRERYTCRLCGECNIGCNFGSKNTLDLNYLSRFAEAGGEIKTLAEVKTLAPRPEGGFTVGYVSHEEEGRPRLTLSADRVVLAAGSLGSTYLLLRNRDSFPNISRALGTHWCGNGDLLGFLTRARRPLDPAVGPVITSALRYEGEGGRGYYIEDGGYPNFVNWLYEMTDARGELRRAARFGWRRIQNWLLHRPVSNLSGEFSALLGDTVKSSNTVPLLGMGRDVPDGRLSLRDGILQNDWSIKTSRAYYDSVKRSMQGVARTLGAKFVDEPLWYFKRVVTVHPVGGCPMSRTADEGVVDLYGQVFGYPGLSVADGSVLPGPVGPNPSLTIAALADRSAGWMLAHWQPTG